jgi:hypothetical protein
MNSAMGNTIVRELRSRLQDVRPSVPSLTVGCTDTTATSVLLEITGGRFILTVVGSGTIKSLDLDLTRYPYDTVGGLFDTLQRHSGLSVQRSDLTSEEHLSADLQAGGPWELAADTSGVELRHHLYSDVDLERFIQQAVSRHNPSLRLNQIPPGEVELILMLAQAAAIRQKVNDVIRRKGTSSDVQSLTALAQSFEDSYSSDLRRLQRAVVPVPEAKPSEIGTGDIMLGVLTRRSLRTGYVAPANSAQPPAPPNFLSPEEEDEGDTTLRFRWLRDPSPNVVRYEVWIDTVAKVERYTDEVQQTTAKLIYKGMAPQVFPERDRFGSYISTGEHSTLRMVGTNLEPETDYYARVYAVDVNDQVIGGEVRKYRTKPLRTMFDKNNLPVSNALIGATITLKFDSTKGPVTASSQIRLGGKIVPHTVVSPTEATVVVPSFSNTTDAKDLVVCSPSGLVDVLRLYLQVSAT